MKSESYQILVALLTFAPLYLYGIEAPGRIYELSALNSRWVPGLIKDRETVVNDRGEVVDTSVQTISCVPRADGTLVFSLRQFLHNGRDETRMKRRKFSYSLTAFDDEINPEQIFDKAVGERVRWLAPLQKDVSDERLRGYRFHLEGIVLWTGVLWTDSHSGIPVRLEYSTDETIESDDYVIYNFSGTLHFNHSADHWYVVRTDYQMDVYVSMFLVLKNRWILRHEVILDEYTLY